MRNDNISSEVISWKKNWKEWFPGQEAPSIQEISWDSIFPKDGKVRGELKLQQPDLLCLLPCSLRVLMRKGKKQDLGIRTDYSDEEKKKEKEEKKKEKKTNPKAENLIAFLEDQRKKSGCSVGWSYADISRFFTADNDGNARFQEFHANLKHHVKNSNYSFETSPTVKELAETISEFCKRMPEDARAEFYGQVKKILEDFLKNLDFVQACRLKNKIKSGIIEKIDANEAESFKPYIMFIEVNGEAFLANVREALSENRFEDSNIHACLLLLASTWVLWRKVTDKTELKTLSHIIFPSCFIRSDEEDGKDWLSEKKEDEKERAKNKILSAKDNYEKREYRKCVDACLDVIRMSFASDEELGEAYYYATICRENHGIIWPGAYSASEWMSRAQSLGNKKALRAWKIAHLDSLVFEPAPFSQQNVNFFLNTSNERTEVFLRSLSYGDTTSTICSFRSEAGDAAFLPKSRSDHRVFLLADDSEEKNFQDLLYILNRLRDGCSFEKPTLIDDVEIFVRLSSEKYAALVDTAIKQMNGAIVPVHIVDENKFTAQWLLGRHPIFYPIRSLSKNALNNKKNKVFLNLVIICENNEELAMWIAREAFWLGCFHYEGVHLEITILSQSGDEIKDTLYCRCNGIFEDNSDDGISSVSVKVVSMRGHSIDSPELFEHLEKLGSVNNYFPYYVVLAKDDISSINLGIQVREWSIRNRVKKMGKIGKADLPVIAVHCENDNIAHLASKMVVQTVDHGDSWYNNYAIIPFGMRNDLYSGKQLMEDYFELAARSTHLQYSGAIEKATRSELNAALAGFYQRYYNYDSSKAGALSIPYRLFQIKDNSPSTGGREHIIPDGWSIFDADIYTDLSETGSVKTMAKILEEQLSSDCETRVETEGNLTRHEHARWTRWMISRGWIPSTIEETASYMTAGNPKQQLFVARMHSCMIPFDKLSDLQSGLYTYKSRGKQFEAFEGRQEKNENGKWVWIYDYFTSFDKDSVKKTPNIMRLSWPKIID